MKRLVKFVFVSPMGRVLATRPTAVAWRPGRKEDCRPNCATSSIHDSQCIMTTAPMAEAEAALMECRVQNGLDDVDQRRLHDTVTHRGYS